MGVIDTSEQIIALAPDEQVAKDGKKHATLKFWKNQGRNADASWGECQGSALYQVRVEAISFAAKCTCPSRKQPCKHVIGLLLLALDAKAVPEAEPPVWVTEWLSKRATDQQQRQEKKKEPKKADDAPSANQLRRVQKREALIAQGLDNLDLWMNDSVRQGLATAETKPSSFWERQAAAMVDAQAPGLSLRLKRMAEIPGSSNDWPDRLLGQLGKLALITHTYRRADALVPELRDEVRQLVGWRIDDDEVLARGEAVGDDWLMLGQHVQDEENHGRSQHTWLLGERTGRSALIIQYSYLGAPWKEPLRAGISQPGEIAFWPGSAKLRARFVSRVGEAAPLAGRIPGLDSIEAFLSGVAATMARQPWQERFLCPLRDVSPLYTKEDDRWWLRDCDGVALPLHGGDHWKLLALSGGHSVDFAGEWDGSSVLPLGVMVDGAYTSLWEGA